MNMIEKFVMDRTKTRGVQPILTDVSYKVKVKAGLARVRMTRIFTNNEERAIEALMTFPVPFDAVVTRLKVENDGRKLRGVAQPKVKARESYEEAVDSGKAAVLHEELMRGLHMVSVANVLPGKEIKVETEFAVPLVIGETDCILKIPQTVGDVYGTSPFPASDDIVADGEALLAKVEFEGDFNGVSLDVASGHSRGHKSDGTTYEVSTGFPIYARFVGCEGGKLLGATADGKAVELEIIRDNHPPATSINCDILLDISYSMSEDSRIRGERGALSKFEQVVRILKDQRTLPVEIDDQFTGWEFNNSCRKVFSCSGRELAENVSKFSNPSGGTNIADAVRSVVTGREVDNVLLITDGRSSVPIDIQGAVKSGARFTVILVGDGALEAYVGYLAAMTGGRVYAVSDENLTNAMVWAFNSMGADDRSRDKGKADVVRACGNSTVFARKLGKKTKAPERKGFARLAAAYAAHMLGQSLDEEEAAGYFAAEGIVSHLTSIVMVDEAAEATEGLPQTKKVSLARDQARFVPSGSAVPMGSVTRSAGLSLLSEAPMRSFAAFEVKGQAFMDAGNRSRGAKGWKDEESLDRPMKPELVEIPDLPGFDIPEPGKWPKVSVRLRDMNLEIDWTRHAADLANGNLECLDMITRAKLVSFAGLGSLEDLAAREGVSISLLLLVLLADVANKNGDIYAGRVYRALSSRISPEGLKAAKDAYPE